MCQQQSKIELTGICNVTNNQNMKLNMDMRMDWLVMQNGYTEKNQRESSERMQEILDGNDTCKSHESQQVCVSAKWRK